jgi:hypothetical protein
MPTKQKVTIAAIVVVLLILVWQVAGMMGIGSGGSEPEPVITEVKSPGAMAAGGPQQASAQPGSPQAGSPQQAAQPQQPPQPAADNSQSLLKESAFLNTQKQIQEKYVDILNELQMLKLQREISETNQAIAIAKLATVKAEKDVSDLLTKPTAPASSYANQLGAGMPGMPGMPPGSAGPITSAQPSAGGPPATVEKSADFVVISVSMQFNKWTAVLGYNGTLYNVAVGDVLSDGSVVTRITKESVTLKKNDDYRRIGLTTSL